MKNLTQTIRFHKLDGTVEETIQTYLYAEHGSLERDGKPAGIVIVLGTNDSQDNYSDPESGVARDIPESLTDIDVYEGDDEEATEEDLYESLNDLGVE